MQLSKAKLAIFGVLGIVAMLVAACGSSTSSSPGTSSNGYNFTYTYQAQKPGGTLVTGDWQSADDNGGIAYINGFIAAASVNLMITNNIWDGCLVQLPDLKLASKGWVTSQCSSLPTESADLKSTTIHLDPAAKWSDGQPITADDYLFTFEMLLDPNVAGGPNPYNYLTGMPTKVDANTFTMNWTIPYAPYLGSIPSPTCVHCYPGVYDATTGKYDTNAAQKLLTADNFNYTPPATNGGYTIQSHGTDGTYTMVPNPNYFSHIFHKATLDKLIFKTTGNKDVLIQSFKAGQYDYAQDFTIADDPKFTSIDPTQVISSPALEFEHLEFNQRSTAPNAKSNSGQSIFADANVRKAFIEAFDRCSAFQALLGPNCKDPSVFTNEVTSPVDASYDAAAPLPTYNLADANTLLDNAGFKKNSAGARTFPNGTPLSVNITTTVGNIVRTSYEQLYANALNNVGVKVNVLQDKTIFSGWDGGGTLATGTFDIALFAFSSASDDDALSATVSTAQIPSATNKAGQNYAGVKDPKVDAYLAQGRSEADPAARVKIYHDLLSYISGQSYYLPLYARPDIALMDGKIGNYLSDPTSTGNNWNTPDWFVKS